MSESEKNAEKLKEIFTSPIEKTLKLRDGTSIIVKLNNEGLCIDHFNKKGDEVLESMYDFWTEILYKNESENKSIEDKVRKLVSDVSKIKFGDSPLPNSVEQKDDDKDSESDDDEDEDDSDEEDEEDETDFDDDDDEDSSEEEYEGGRVKYLQDTFKLSEDKAKELDELLTKVVESDDYNETETLFDQVSDFIGGNGVEIINQKAGNLIDNYWRECAFRYVNMGDTYDQTIIYSTKYNKIIISDWGSLVEKHSDRYD